MALNSILQVSFSNHSEKGTVYKVLVYFPKDNTSNTKFYMQMDESIQRHDHKTIKHSLEEI